jgi:hypothetical protein
MVFEDALVQIQPPKTTIARWNEINALVEKIRVYHFRGGQSITRVYTVTRNDGVELVFNHDFADLNKLVETVRRAIFPRLFTLAQELLNQNQELNFGRLDITPEGIRDGSSVISWEEVETVNEDLGSISIQKKGKWLAWSKVDTAAIPNLSVFLTLVRKKIVAQN